MSMASIILPFYEPTFYTYNIYGSVTSMLSNNDHYLPWLYNNFIQIRYVEDWDSYFSITIIPCWIIFHGLIIISSP